MTDKILTGVVSEFDAKRGLGDIVGDDGNVWPFHCAEISDGSRQISVGQRVSFVTKFHVVRTEAFSVTPLSSAG